MFSSYEARPYPSGDGALTIAESRSGRPLMSIPHDFRTASPSQSGQDPAGPAACSCAYLAREILTAFRCPGRRTRWLPRNGLMISSCIVVQPLGVDPAHAVASVAVAELSATTAG